VRSMKVFDLLGVGSFFGIALGCLLIALSLLFAQANGIVIQICGYVLSIMFSWASFTFGALGRAHYKELS
jgi:hypothetical protein